MATKTFKIGLSNTDKQNMAQDVYERLLALTFPEYDTSTSYSVGDFVVYNDQLYKCIGATTGAWDSTKWQLATLNDLVTDIEDAVSFVNDKANVDGNYPTMTVGVADQLSPYDDESGDDQDEPFSFQATGTGNGTQPDFATGAIALMKEKRGNSVVVNQLAAPYGSTETKDGITFTRNDDGSYTISGTASADTDKAIATCNSIAGHKYLLFGCPASGSLSTYYLYDGYFAEIDSGAGIIYQPNSSHLMPIQIVVKNGTVISTPVTIKPYLIDLTKWFNGDIPQDLLDNPENFFRYYQGSLAYNTGELVNANGRYIKCIGRNQWDEEWELGYIDDSNGNLIPPTSGYENTIRSKNYCKCVPNATYYGLQPADKASQRIYWYDINKNYISSDYLKNSTSTAPGNACFFKWALYNYGTTYNHDITISLYYEGESGYDQYYPYELLTNNDTGTETLLAFDYKTPDGTIHHNTVKYTFTGSEDWQLGSSGYNYYCIVSDIGYKCPDTNSLPKGITAVGEFETYSRITTQLTSNKIALHPSNNAVIAISSDLYTNRASLTGKSFEVEIATPTTEQGTPYSENLVIDDFGSMDFGGTNGVPQGNLIFYPVDYKAFIDTLYDYTEGTPSNIALKSDLASDKSELQGVDSQLQNAIGGTLRQCLCVKESLDFDNTNFVDMGNLSWEYDSDYQLFSAVVESNVGSSAGGRHSLCTKYKTGSSWDTLSDKSIIYADNGYSGNSKAIVKDTTYTDATTFKSAMKGVLLAYEKGE